MQCHWQPSVKRMRQIFHGTMLCVIYKNRTLEKITEEDGKILVYLHSDLSASELNHFLFSKNIALSHLVKRKNSLEAQFLELTKNAIIQNN